MTQMEYLIRLQAEREAQVGYESLDSQDLGSLTTSPVGSFRVSLTNYHTFILATSLAEADLIQNL